MHLNAEIVLRINDLDQQRETIHSRVSEQLGVLLPANGQTGPHADRHTMQVPPQAPESDETDLPVRSAASVY